MWRSGFGVSVLGLGFRVQASDGASYFLFEGSRVLSRYPYVPYKLPGRANPGTPLVPFLRFVWFFL